MTDAFDKPVRIHSKLEKRRADDPTAEPYEVIEDVSWHDIDGSEITDERAATLEAEHQERNR